MRAVYGRPDPVLSASSASAIGQNSCNASRAICRTESVTIPSAKQRQSPSRNITPRYGGDSGACVFRKSFCVMSFVSRSLVVPIGSIGRRSVGRDAQKSNSRDHVPAAAAADAPCAGGSGQRPRPADRVCATSYLKPHAHAVFSLAARARSSNSRMTKDRDLRSASAASSSLSTKPRDASNVTVMFSSGFSSFFGTSRTIHGLLLRVNSRY